MPESPNKLLNNDHGNYVYATYTGHIFDTTLDIYFAEARFYDANTRTWLAMDPIKDGDNWYQYCYSNPLKYWDPFGTNGFTKYACDFFNSVKSGFDQAWNSVSDWVSSIDWGRFGVGLVKGVGATALLVAGMAAILTTGGAAIPVVVGSLSSTAIVWATQILGAATIAFGISDLMEAAQDIAFSLASPETASDNPLRDHIFGMLGLNPEDYYILEAIVGSAAAAGASVVNAFSLGSQAISLQDYVNNKNSSTVLAEGTYTRYMPDGRQVTDVTNLPGSAGIKLSRRLTTEEMTFLTQEYGVEFAQVYKYGNGTNGGGGQYYLYSGTVNRVQVPISNDIMLINHTHPGGTAYPSNPDKLLLQRYQQLGSPQISSEIIPIGKENVRFDKNGLIGE